MTPLEFITRLPRKIELTRKYWKGTHLNYWTPLLFFLTFPIVCFLFYILSFSASEMRNWLLFYGLPCLDGILPEKYFRNFSYLVNGVYLLLKDEITRQEIVIADYCLSNFYLYAEIYYGMWSFPLRILQLYLWCHL